MTDDAGAPRELDGDDGEQQRVAPAPFEHAVEHQVLGVVEPAGLHAEVVAQRVRDASGLAVGVQLGEAEEVAAVFIQALEGAPFVDRPELGGKREQQLVEVGPALPRDDVELACFLHEDRRQAPRLCG